MLLTLLSGFRTPVRDVHYFVLYVDQATGRTMYVDQALTSSLYITQDFDTDRSD